MCRYAHHQYRDHFACFRCRKAFKAWRWKWREEGGPKPVGRPRYAPREVVCPDCGNPMTDMGLDFKAPPKSDRKTWEIMETLAANGFHFRGCGCHVGFKPPKRRRDVPAWLKTHRRPASPLGPAWLTADLMQSS